MRSINRVDVEKILNETGKFLKDINVDKLFQKREDIKLAVTGLSRSGKSVFITSLINQLISGKKIERVFRSRGKEFVARVRKLKDDKTQEFDYLSILEDFRGEKPKWPPSTSSLSKIAVEIEVKSNSSFFPNKIINLEIIDYPGEWLFDLEMFGKSFDEWSEIVLSQLKHHIKKDLTKEWQSEINKHDIYGFSDGSDDKKIVELYRDYLKTIQNMGLSLIQPARSIQDNNSLLDPSIILFTPLPKPKYINPHEDSIYTRFKNRYNRYISEIVAPLKNSYFSQFDRQIILVDVLKALENGYDAFVDMAEAIKQIIKIYDYGDRSFLKPFLERRIDKVLFGATKGDHISPNQYSNYRNLLNMIVEEAKRELEVKGVEIKTTIFSSVKSGMANPENLLSIPESFPNRSEWRDKMFKFQPLPPLSFPDRDVDAVEHINLDEVIDYLIGDKL